MWLPCSRPRTIMWKRTAQKDCFEFAQASLRMWSAMRSPTSRMRWPLHANTCFCIRVDLGDAQPDTCHPVHSASCDVCIANIECLTAGKCVQVFLVIAASVVGFVSVLVGRWLHLDYSAKLYVMTFVLVVMAAEHSSGATASEMLKPHPRPDAALPKACL